MKALIKTLLLKYTTYEIRKRRPLPRGSIDALTLALDNIYFEKETPVLLQIGAADGVRNDPLNRYIRSRKFLCVLVEPIPLLFEKLVENYKSFANVTCVNAAITDSDGVVPMYMVRGDSNYGIEKYQLSSLSRQLLLSHGFLPNDIEEIKVRGMTISTLLKEQKLDAVDILQVDTEGYDANVVMMALRAGLMPSLINFEHVHIPEIERVPLFCELSRYGYEWIHDSMNTLAIHSGLTRRCT